MKPTLSHVVHVKDLEPALDDYYFGRYLYNTLKIDLESLELAYRDKFWIKQGWKDSRDEEMRL